MGCSSGPDIIQDGLLCCLEAASKRSYAGSGTSWKNLVDGENAVLANSPPFSSDNGGKFYFDGSNDYCEFAINEKYNFQPTQPFSVFCWMIKQSGMGAVLANMKSVSPHTGWDIWRDGSNNFAMHLISSWSGNAIKVAVNYTSDPNNIIYFGYTYDGSCPANNTDTLNSVNFYSNGKLYTTGKTIASGGNGFNSTSETIAYDPNQRFRLGARHTGQFGSSSLFAVHIYDRALSADEIRQNYLSTKERFA